MTVKAHDSHENLDRVQGQATLDPDAPDRVFEVDTAFGFKLPSTKLRLGVGWSAPERRSRVEHRIVKRNIQTRPTAVRLPF